MAKQGDLGKGLYLIATPIGTARDITLRALDILRDADLLVAEDTRSLRKLMEIHGVSLNGRQIIAYHDHNGDRVRPRILHALKNGQSVVYASEAGTPMVADPGFDLARSARDAGHVVTSAPGPSAVVTAMTLSGLPSDRFLFAGFLPNSKSARKSALTDLKDVPATLVFYESPKRLTAFLADAIDVLGAQRQVAICRELTKKFEEVLKGRLDELALICSERTLKGEIVVVIDRAGSRDVNPDDVRSALRDALETLSVRDAADQVSQDFGLKRRAVYQMALELDKE